MYKLVQFKTKRKQLNYAGVTEVNDNSEDEIVFLRKQPSGVFVKPAAVDRRWIPTTDIVRMLVPPVIDDRGN